MVLCFVLFIVLKSYGGNTPDTESITLKIEKGSSIKTVSEQLKDSGIIKSSFFFTRNVTDSEKIIQAGSFTIPSNANTQEIIEIITGTPQSTRLTILEGQTINEIDEKLANANLIQTGEFIKCTQTCPLPQNFPFKEFTTTTPRNLEGFLFPDTYFIDEKEFTSEAFLTTMLNQFTSKYNEISEQNQTKYSPYQIITMASILEKEVRTTKDLNIVAGILWKRLENDWTIGADATLLYTATDRDITYQDLQSDSPYNTRKFLGLPPTPINNPGQKMLQAAMQPEASEYWFYLTTLDTGEVIYGRTNEEHNANKNKYL